jgi:predicted solute-binding protein
MVMVLYKSVNITSVSSTTKTLGELLLAQKDIHKSGVIVHSKTPKFNQKAAKVNGLVTILK